MSIFEDTAELWAKPPTTRFDKTIYALDYFIEEKFRWLSGSMASMSAASSNRLVPRLRLRAVRVSAA
jgi:hypothetical protein